MTGFPAVVLVLGLAVFAQGAPSRAVSPDGPVHAPLRAMMRNVITAYNGEDDFYLRRCYAPALARAFPPAKRAALFAKMKAAYGSIADYEEIPSAAPGAALLRVAFENRLMDLRLVLDAAGRIADLTFLPLRPDGPVPKRNRTELSFPVRGRWRVLSGGPRDKENPDRWDPTQRFAFSFAMEGENGKAFRTDGKENRDYWCWGREVYAPADGYVVEAIDGIHDNEPGTSNPYGGLGNAVFIRHGADEISVLAHLRQGSVGVKRGDRVGWGDQVGAVGNSGASLAPHLHYHLQSSEKAEKAAAVRSFFREVRLYPTEGSSKKVKDFSPSKGDVLSQP